MEQYGTVSPCEPEVKPKWYLTQTVNPPPGAIEVDTGCMLQGAVMYGHQVVESGDKERMHRVLEFIGNLCSQVS